MFLGLLLNLIFIQLFFTVAPKIKEYNKFYWVHKQFQAEIKEVIDKALENIDLSNIKWEKTESDALLNWYIGENK